MGAKKAKLLRPAQRIGKPHRKYRESKRIKIEGEKELKIISKEVDVLPRVRPPPKNPMTSAYTQSVRDDTNLKTIVKDPLSIRSTSKASVPQLQEEPRFIHCRMLPNGSVRNLGPQCRLQCQQQAEPRFTHRRTLPYGRMKKLWLRWSLGSRSGNR